MPANRRSRKTAVPRRTRPSRGPQSPRPIRIRKVVLRSAAKKPASGPQHPNYLDARSGPTGISVHVITVDFESGNRAGLNVATLKPGRGRGIRRSRLPPYTRSTIATCRQLAGTSASEYPTQTRSLQQGGVACGRVEIQCPLIDFQVHRHGIIDVDVDISGVTLHLNIVGLNRQILFLRFFQNGLLDLFNILAIYAGKPCN